mmetsp:Transcript_12992/g.35960  ORF Transcript_12992/g.35960 Transcript_12992/m.35960 type:complete len:207 (-) Transcript_12992:73-693(-)
MYIYIMCIYIRMCAGAGAPQRAVRGGGGGAAAALHDGVAVVEGPCELVGLGLHHLQQVEAVAQLHLHLRQLAAVAADVLRHAKLLHQVLDAVVRRAVVGHGLRREAEHAVVGAGARAGGVGGGAAELRLEHAQQLVQLLLLALKPVQAVLRLRVKPAHHRHLLLHAEERLVAAEDDLVPLGHELHLLVEHPRLRLRLHVPVLQYSS